MTREQENDLYALTCLTRKVHKYCEENNCEQDNIPFSDAISLVKEELANLEVAHLNGEPWEDWERQDREEIRLFLGKYDKGSN